VAHPGSADRNIQIRTLLAQADGLRRLGRLADSLVPLQRAAALAPANVAIQFNLGLTLLNCRRPAEAATVLRRAVAADAKFAPAHWRLGMALEAVGDGVSALGAYERAIKLDASLAHALYRVAALYELSGRRREAAIKYHQASSAAREPELRYLTEASALLIEDRDGEAEASLRAWQALNPDNPDMNEMLGGVLSDSGRFDEAARAYETALDKDPGRIGLFYDLVRLRKFTDADRPVIERMRTASEASSGDPEQLCRLHLAIGKAHDDLGECEAAMREFDLADAVRSGLNRFDPKALEDLVDRIIERFDAASLAAMSGRGLTDATPILIFGMPRSGTTLMEQIVSSHRDVAGAGEVLFWDRRGQLAMERGGIAADPSFLRSAAGDYIAFLRSRTAGADRIVDKQLNNFLWAGLIHLSLPNAPMIHCRRQPIDTAVSIHQTYFNPRLPFPTGGTDLVRYYRAYERMTAHWRAVLPADRFLDIDYEDLTANPESVIRRAIAFCGLSWDDACLHPEHNQRAVKTPSKWQVRQSIGQGSVDRWRRYEPWLGPLAELK
jgi:tetratricopeptide (TPR) repeat protein